MTGIVITLIVTASLSASPGGSAWTVRPEFQIGQELVFEGKIRDTYKGQGVSSESDRRILVRVLTLEKSASQTAKVACSTAHLDSDTTVATKLNSLTDALALRLDLLQVDDKGNVRWFEDKAELAPPTSETMVSELGFFIEPAPKPLKINDHWVVRRGGQPPIRFTVIGPDTVTQVKCVQLHVEQESQNWANAEISLPAWKIDEMVWYDDKSHSIFKVDRTVETRDPASPEIAYSRQVTYEQVSNVKYHGTVFQNQSTDFMNAYAAQKSLEKALATQDEVSRTKLLKSFRRENEPNLRTMHTTMYRSALDRMLRTADAAEKFVAEADDEPAPSLIGRRDAVVGDRAPHFVVRSTKTGQKISKNTIKGEPTVMVFIDPASELSLDALRTAVKAKMSGENSSVKLLAVCTKIDEQEEKDLRAQVPGDYEVCTGAGSDGAYGITGMPHVVYIDHAGVLRLNQKGFGPELYASLKKDLSAMPAANIADEKNKSRSYRR